MVQSGGGRQFGLLPIVVNYISDEGKKDYKNPQGEHQGAQEARMRREY